MIDATLAAPWTFGMVLSATATNLGTGDTSEFARTIPESPAIQFTADAYTRSTRRAARGILHHREPDLLISGTSTVNYATVQGGTAIPNVDYIQASGTLTFDPGESTKTFVVPRSLMTMRSTRSRQ